MSQVVAENTVVDIHYELTDDEGTVLDSSEGAEPLSYLHGAGNIIPGLEQALSGKSTEENFKVHLEPDDAYGQVMPELVQTIPRSAFQGVDNVEVGMNFEAQGPDGQVQRVRVKEVEGDDVTIDANHPLAGVPLNFDVQVVGVRDATEEEITHGHAH